MPGTSREIRLFKLANLTSRNPYVAYTIAISAVVLATLIRFGIDAHIVPPAPFRLRITRNAILVAFFCGLGPAVLAGWLSGVIAWYVFLPPPYTFTLDKTQTTTLILFFIVAGINVAIVGLLNRAMARIVTYERFARSTADEFGNRVENSKHTP